MHGVDDIPLVYDLNASGTGSNTSTAAASAERSVGGVRTNYCHHAPTVQQCAARLWRPDPYVRVNACGLLGSRVQKKNVFMLPPHAPSSRRVAELRVAVALALVKALRRLPPAILTDELPPLLTKVCLVLRSRSEEQRAAARRYEELHFQTCVSCCSAVHFL